MSLISITFLAFLLITFLAYFFVPLKARWLVLFTGSIVFLAWGGWENVLFLAITAVIVYTASIWMAHIYERNEQDLVRQVTASFKEKHDAKQGADSENMLSDKEYVKSVRDAKRQSYSSSKKKTKWILFLTVAMILAMLVYSKAGKNIAEALSSVLHGQALSIAVIVPIGISYYSFSAIGYLADVYWKKDKAENNPLKLFLYLAYFPHITQGPIPRHSRLASQLVEGHPFEYQRVCFGLQRIVWGYFKKLVVADRFACIVSKVFSDYEKYEGLIFVVAIIASAIQLYTDFSGCMDIALGVSEVFGITLDENFKRPFFAKSAAEFWRRWHITLGSWFRDYVYMPLVVSPALIKISNGSRKVFGKRFAKNLLMVIPLAVVWLLTGLWHGTGKNYIAWGIWWGSIIILATVLAPELKKLTLWLKINTKSPFWMFFQMVRTFVIFCIGRLLTAPLNLYQSFQISKKIWTQWNPWVFFDGTMYQLGLDRYDFWIAVLSVVVIWFVGIKQEKGIKIRQTIAAYPIVFRWIVYFGATFATLILGYYGSGHIARTFLYAAY